VLALSTVIFCEEKFGFRYEGRIGKKFSPEQRKMSLNTQSTRFLSHEDIASFFNENDEWIIRGTEINHCREVMDVDCVEWNNLVDWLENQLFMPGNPHFAVIKIGMSLLGTSRKQPGSLSGLNQTYAKADNIEELYIRGDDVKCSLLKSLLDRGAAQRHKTFFTGHQYAVAGRHMKETVHQCTELGLHWDPLEISVLGTTYHKDEHFEGGHARVADLAAYLRQYGCFSTREDGRVIPFCCRPYPPQSTMDKYALEKLESREFQTDIYIPWDCVTLVFCNNHIDLFNPERCGVLHDAAKGSALNQAPSKRRVALCSIQDVSNSKVSREAREAYASADPEWNIYIKYPYITPAFRSMAASYIHNRQVLDPSGSADGFWDGEKQEWFLGQCPALLRK